MNERIDWAAALARLDSGTIPGVRFERSDVIPAEYRARCALVGCERMVEAGDPSIYVRIEGEENGGVMHPPCARIGLGI